MIYLVMNWDYCDTYPIAAATSRSEAEDLITKFRATENYSVSADIEIVELEYGKLWDSI